MARQSKSQKATVERVMHEFKDGELTQKGGRKIKDRRQAIAIALSEAGASRNQSPAENRKRRRRNAASGQTRDELYREAARRGIVGRSRMTKRELERALARR